MNTQELIAFVQGLATKPESWRHLVEHDRAARTYSELLRDDNVAAWLICWMDEHDTGFHDHDVSAGAVAVVSGSVREDRLVLGAEPSTRVLGPGSTFSFEPSDIHRVQHAAPSRPSRSTRTRRRCGGWAPTRSTPRGASCATRSPTPRSSGRSGRRRDHVADRRVERRNVSRGSAYAATHPRPGRPSRSAARPPPRPRPVSPTGHPRRRPAAPRRTPPPRRRWCARAAARAPRRRSSATPPSVPRRRRRPRSGSGPSSATGSRESRRPKATPSSTACTQRPAVVAQGEPR